MRRYLSKEIDTGPGVELNGISSLGFNVQAAHPLAHTHTYAHRLGGGVAGQGRKREKLNCTKIYVCVCIIYITIYMKQYI